jgi:hypothetical protein
MSNYKAYILSRYKYINFELINTNNANNEYFISILIILININKIISKSKAVSF